MEYASLAVGVIGVLLAIIVFYANRKPKRLHYYTVFEQPLLHTNSRYMTGHLVVTVDGREVQHPVTMVIRFINSGRTEIRPEDYADPISIRIPGDNLVSLDAIGGPGDFGDLQVELRFTPEGDAEVIMPPLLLNPGEFVDVLLLLDGAETTHYALRGRIAGARLHEGEPGAGRRRLLGSEGSFWANVRAAPLKMGTSLNTGAKR